MRALAEWVGISVGVDVGDGCAPGELVESVMTAVMLSTALGVESAAWATVP